MRKILLLAVCAVLTISTSGQLIDSPESRSSVQSKNQSTESSVTGFSVFPNPVTRKNFCIVSEINLITEVKILNITGKIIYIKKFNDPVQKFEVFLPDVPEGIYLVNTKLTDNLLYAVKIMVRNQ